MIISAQRTEGVIGGVLFWRSFGVKDTCISGWHGWMMQAVR